MKQPEDLGFEALRQAEEAARTQRHGMRVVQGVRKASWRSRLPRVSVVVQHFLFLGGVAGITASSYMLNRIFGTFVASVLAISLSFILSKETDEPSKPSPQGR